MITYRLEKGAALSILEIDNNFREIEQRLADLEDKEFQGTFEIEQKEDVLVFKHNKQPISQVILPKFQPIFKGAWVKDFNYRIGVWVYKEQKLYACKVPHTSGANIEPSFWQLVFDGGETQ
jgi:hypothetical protein